MKQKVLILGPSFFGYNYSIQRAFQAQGYHTSVIEYDEPVHPFNLKNMIWHKLFPRSKKLREKSRAAFNAFVLNAYETYQPDLVFIYNGDILEKETIRLFRKKSKVAVWMLDGVFRHPDSIAIAPEVDVYFCFEQSDVDKLTPLGINACFLPQGYDPTVYFPMETEKDIDILFVGALYQYPKRIRLLKLLVDAMGDDYIIRVYGKYKPFVKDPVKWLFRERRDIFLNKNVPSEIVNSLYNRAKICINIHHEQSVNGANPKVFEICGSAAFQMVDYKQYIAEIFSRGEVTLYTSDDDFIQKVRQYIISDTTWQAAEAHRVALMHHTFDCRIKEALSVINAKK